MKIRTILERANTETTNIVRSGERFSDPELEVLFNIIRTNKELDQSELIDLAKQVAEMPEWKRNFNSARLGLARMHVLYHGIAPQGYTERTAEQMFIPSGPMDRFVEQHGINAERNRNKAKAEIAQRVMPRKPKMKEVEARQVMAQYAKENKANITQSHRSHVQNIIADIMHGLTADEAFARWA